MVTSPNCRWATAVSEDQRGDVKRRLICIDNLVMMIGALLTLFVLNFSPPAFAFFGDKAREQSQIETINRLVQQRLFNDALPLITPLAEKGNVDMQLLLGLLYYQGDIPGNHQRGQEIGPNGESQTDGRAWASISRRWFERVVNNAASNDENRSAAWHGIAITWCCWPRFRSDITLTSQEWSASVAAFEKAIALRNATSMFILAMLLGNGKEGVPRNDTRALQLIDRLAGLTDIEPALKAEAHQLALVISDRRQKETKDAEKKEREAKLAEERRLEWRERVESGQRRAEVERRRAEEDSRKSEEMRAAAVKQAALRAQAQAAEARREERELIALERGSAQICKQLNSACPRLSSTGKSVIEEIANRQSIDPRSIRLDRVTVEEEFAEDQFGSSAWAKYVNSPEQNPPRHRVGCNCKAVFWTSSGTLTCRVREYEGLTLKAISNCWK